MGRGMMPPGALKEGCHFVRRTDSKFDRGAVQCGTV